MNEQEARDNIKACIALCGNCDYQDRICHEYEKGLLEGLKQGRREERQKAEKLVEALQEVGNIIGGPISGYLAPRNNEQSMLIEKASNVVKEALEEYSNPCKNIQQQIIHEEIN